MVRKIRRKRQGKEEVKHSKTNQVRYAEVVGRNLILIEKTMTSESNRMWIAREEV